MPAFLAARLNTSSDILPPETFLKFSKNSNAPVFALGILETNLYGLANIEAASVKVSPAFVAGCKEGSTGPASPIRASSASLAARVPIIAPPTPPTV